jgi:hypothetical protein
VVVTIPGYQVDNLLALVRSASEATERGRLERKDDEAEGIIERLEAQRGVRRVRVELLG